MGKTVGFWFMRFLKCKCDDEGGQGKKKYVRYRNGGGGGVMGDDVEYKMVTRGNAVLDLVKAGFYRVDASFTCRAWDYAGHVGW